MKIAVYCLSFILAIFCCSCHFQVQKENNQITLFCAVGLTDIITELKDSFEQKNDVDIKLNLASSGTLARQLAQGAQADIFIPASRQWADYADSLGLFSRRKAICQNQLVFIAPLNSLLDSIDFRSETPPEFNAYLSMGDPEHVPAGEYAREALTNLGWWPDMQKRMLPSKDIRSALMLVELGECELGLVYLSDALASKKVKILGTLPESTHPPIVFYAQLSPTPSTSAKAYFEMLTDTLYQESWLRYGLKLVKPN